MGNKLTDENGKTVKDGLGLETPIPPKGIEKCGCDEALHYKAALEAILAEFADGKHHDANGIWDIAYAALQLKPIKP